jgi:hypothetical protein
MSDGISENSELKLHKKTEGKELRRKIKIKKENYFINPAAIKMTHKAQTKQIKRQ